MENIIMIKIRSNYKFKFVIIIITLFISNVHIFAANTDRVVDKLSARVNALEEQNQVLKTKIANIETKCTESNKDHKGTASFSPDTVMRINTLLTKYEERPFIVSSPVFGVRRPDDHFSSLMNKLSSMNEDLLLLRLRQKMDNYFKAHNIPFATRPVIAFSGGLEAGVDYRSNDRFNTTAKSSITLNKAELDVLTEIGSWTTGAMIIDYEDSSAPYTGNTPKWSNSRLRINRAWVTLGKLNKTPFYFTIGQVYAPFGSFGSNMLTTPAIRTIGRVKDRMVVLGYSGKDGIYAQIFGLDGESRVNGAEFIRHTGANIGYRIENEQFALNIGASILGNLADSQGMQDSVFGKTTNGTTTTVDAERINSRVFGLNGRITATLYGKYNLLAEYIGASNSFNQADLAFNGHGAKPQALELEGSYVFKVFGKPSSVYAATGMSSQALALNVTKQSYATGFTISPTTYALTSIEYRHDINYSWGDTGDSANRIKTVTVSKRHNNKITLSLGVYF